MENRACVINNISVIGYPGLHPAPRVHVGKSCLINRFLPHLKYSENHLSVLSLSDFDGEVVCSSHWLYWGETTINFNDLYAKIRIIEHCEFVDDHSFLPISQPSSYIERALLTKLHVNSPKLTYVCKEQLGHESVFPRLYLEPTILKIDGFICIYDVTLTGKLAVEQANFLREILLRVAFLKLPLVLATTKHDGDVSYQATCLLKNSLLNIKRKWIKKHFCIVETSSRFNINVAKTFHCAAFLAQFGNNDRYKIKANLFYQSVNKSFQKPKLFSKEFKKSVYCNLHYFPFDANGLSSSKENYSDSTTSFSYSTHSFVRPSVQSNSFNDLHFNLCSQIISDHSASCKSAPRTTRSKSKEFCDTAFVMPCQPPPMLLFGPRTLESSLKPTTTCLSFVSQPTSALDYSTASNTEQSAVTAAKPIPWVRIYLQGSTDALVNSVGQVFQHFCASDKMLFVSNRHFHVDICSSAPSSDHLSGIVCESFTDESRQSTTFLRPCGASGLTASQSSAFSVLNNSKHNDDCSSKNANHPTDAYENDVDLQVDLFVYSTNEPADDNKGDGGGISFGTAEAAIQSFAVGRRCLESRVTVGYLVCVIKTNDTDDAVRRMLYFGLSMALKFRLWFVVVTPNTQNVLLHHLLDLSSNVNAQQLNYFRLHQCLLDWSYLTPFFDLVSSVHYDLLTGIDDGLVDKHHLWSSLIYRTQTDGAKLIAAHNDSLFVNRFLSLDWAMNLIFATLQPHSDFGQSNMALLLYYPLSHWSDISKQIGQWLTYILDHKSKTLPQFIILVRCLDSSVCTKFNSDDICDLYQLAQTYRCGLIQMDHSPRRDYQRHSQYEFGSNSYDVCDSKVVYDSVVTQSHESHLNKLGLTSRHVLNSTLCLGVFTLDVSNSTCTDAYKQILKGDFSCWFSPPNYSTPKSSAAIKRQSCMPTAPVDSVIRSDHSSVMQTSDPGVVALPWLPLSPMDALKLTTPIDSWNGSTGQQQQHYHHHYHNNNNLRAHRLVSPVNVCCHHRSQSLAHSVPHKPAPTCFHNPFGCSHRGSGPFVPLLPNSVRLTNSAGSVESVVDSSMTEYYAELPKVSKLVNLEEGERQRRRYLNRPKRPCPDLDSSSTYFHSLSALPLGKENGHTSSESPLDFTASSDSSAVIITNRTRNVATSKTSSCGDLIGRLQELVDVRPSAETGSAIYAEVNDTLLHSNCPMHPSCSCCFYCHSSGGVEAKVDAANPYDHICEFCLIHNSEMRQLGHVGATTETHCTCSSPTNALLHHRQFTKSAFRPNLPTSTCCSHCKYRSTSSVNAADVLDAIDHVYALPKHLNCSGASSPIPPVLPARDPKLHLPVSLNHQPSPSVPPPSVSCPTSSTASQFNFFNFGGLTSMFRRHGQWFRNSTNRRVRKKSNVSKLLSNQ